jgi:hypothetical protein
MKNAIVFILALTLVLVLFYAGINGMMRGHSYGPFFIFLGICAAAGLAIDASKLYREKVKQANARKFGR